MRDRGVPTPKSICPRSKVGNERNDNESERYKEKGWLHKAFEVAANTCIGEKETQLSLARLLVIAGLFAITVSHALGTIPQHLDITISLKLEVKIVPTIIPLVIMPCFLKSSKS